MGRGTEVRKRTHQINVRLTPAEYAAVTEAAADLGLSPGEYLRNRAALVGPVPRPGGGNVNGEHDARCEREYAESGYVFIDCLCHIRRAKAEAWDEGLDAGLREPNPGASLELPPNPYRFLRSGEGADDSLYMLRHRDRSGAWAHSVAWITRVRGEET